MLAKALASTAKAVEPAYIEDVFSTWLYTGNGSTQTITNGIDLSGKGGLVWIKSRSNAFNNVLYDTVRGVNSQLVTNSSGAATTYNGIAFQNTGFVDQNYWSPGVTLASWTFRKQPKFFDVVTYTGDGNSSRTVSHNLGSVPGCIIVKSVSAANDWAVSHISLTDQLGFFNQNYQFSASSHLRNSLWTSTTFTPGSAAVTNQNGVTYVAYLFAHDAGGFGLTGTDNVISCGSFSPSGGVATVNLGYEPQWLLWKQSSGTDSWSIIDTMRGWTARSGSERLLANLPDAESSFGPYMNLTSTGFETASFSSGTYIYIAIRRGPMKVPTSGTSVFSPNAYSGTGTSTIQTLTTNFPVDAFIHTSRQDSTTDRSMGNRLTGQGKYLLTNLTAAEQTILSGNGVNNTVGFASNTGIGVQGDWNNPSSPGYSPYIMWNFRRAPSFFDVVCITGPTTTVSHNLGVAPEICIFKRRNGTSNWPVQLPSRYLFLNSDTGNLGAPFVTNFGATTLTVDPGSFSSGETWVGYLFATCPGVSKVGSYTGTGALQTINCGFTGGARFVLIKRTDSTGDWYVWDTARGIVSGNDPYLLLNSTAAEVTSTDYIDTYSAGFEISSTAPAAINANGGTYIFLAIA